MSDRKQDRYSRGNYATKAGRPRRRSRAVPIVIAIVVVAVVAAGVVFFLMPKAGEQAASQDAVVADTTEMGEAVPQMAEDQAEPAPAEQPAEPAPAAHAPGDLAWRDADFAVDPAKPCGSNADNGRKTVYLTIDDGPSPLTAQVLDILDRYNCKATFFVTGHDPDSYPMIAEAYRRGHTIGLHTFSHDYAQVYSSLDAYFADLDAIGQVVRDQIGYVPCFVRFPGGTSNTISANYTPGIMGAITQEVNARGYQYYDWDASVGDGSEHTADEVFFYATEASPETNIVLLCHDSATKQSTVDALPRIIEHYQGLGYTFEAIDRTTWTPHHPVNN